MEHIIAKDSDGEEVYEVCKTFLVTDIPERAYQSLLERGVHMLAHMHKMAPKPQTLPTNTDLNLHPPVDDYQFSVVFKGTETLEEMTGQVKGRVKQLFKRHPGLIQRLAENASQDEESIRIKRNGGQLFSTEDLKTDQYEGKDSQDEHTNPAEAFAKQLAEFGQATQERALQYLEGQIGFVTEDIMNAIVEQYDKKEDGTPDMQGAHNVKFKFTGDQAKDVNLERTALRSRFLYRLVGKKITIPDTQHVKDEGEREEFYLLQGYEIADKLLKQSGMIRNEGRDMYVKDVITDIGRELYMKSRPEYDHEHSTRDMLAETIAGAFHRMDTRRGQPVKLDVIMTEAGLAEASASRFYLQEGEGELVVDVPRYEKGTSYQEMFYDVTERYIETFTKILRDDVEWDEDIHNKVMNVLPTFISMSRNGFVARPQGGFIVKIPYKADNMDQLRYGNPTIMFKTGEDEIAEIDQLM